MKNIKFMYSKIALFLVLILMITVSCERDISEDVEFATLDNTGEIFTDSPIGLGSDFYFPFLGSKATAWSVDNSLGYESEASMRFDVPNANDPEGSYAGAIFRIDGAGRDLTEYDALTFWAKASQGVNIGEFGFGQDFLENKHQVNISNVTLSTNWVKYIIPIPDATKLFDERGMFWYSAGTQETGGFGYIFWIDDLQFEKLGTIGQVQPKIYGGQDVDVQTYVGTDGIVELPTVTFNLGTGQNVTVNAARSYFDWTSSDPNIVTIDETGYAGSHSTGEAVITASSAGVQAQGSLTVTVFGAFNFAPTPTRDPGSVISLFSDAYDDVPYDFFNGYWEPWQTTESANFEIDGDHILNYTNFNFVGNQFPTIDATLMSHIHFDVFVPDGTVNPQLKITLKDFGPNGEDGGDDDTTLDTDFNSAQLIPGQWNSLDIPVAGLSPRNKFGQIIYDFNDSGLTNFYLDNIYFYSE